MVIPDPVTPLALAAGVSANIATDILKHHVRSLESTLAGRMLKWAGLIQPNFDDRIRDTVAQALELFFQTYPAFRLTGIEFFFRDPTTAKQIAGFILDRKPINPQEIESALGREFGNDWVTGILIQQRGLDPTQIIPGFLKCYRRILVQQASSSEIAILLELYDAKDSLIQEMHSSEERLANVVRQVLGKVDSHEQMLQGIASDIKVIKQKLGVDSSREVLGERIQSSLDAARSSMFESGGWCSGYQFEAMADKYFLAQAFTPDREDLERALTKALRDFGVDPIVADKIFWHGHIICKISALIQSTPFGVYQLTKNQNRNVHLELGIAVGLGRPFVLIKDLEAEVSPMLQGLEYYPIESYLELSYALGARLRPFVTDIGKYKPPKLSAPGANRTAVIAHGNIEAVDFSVAISRILLTHNLTPAILGDPQGRVSEYLTRERIPHSIIGEDHAKILDASVEAIQKARLGIFRVEKDSSADAFTALGIALGLNRPVILAQKRNKDIPSDLAGTVKLDFDSYSKLEEDFPKRYSALLQHCSA